MARMFEVTFLGIVIGECTLRNSHDWEFEFFDFRPNDLGKRMGFPDRPSSLEINFSSGSARYTERVRSPYKQLNIKWDELMKPQVSQVPPPETPIEDVEISGAWGR